MKKIISDIGHFQHEIFFRTNQSCKERIDIELNYIKHFCSTQNEYK